MMRRCTRKLISPAILAGLALLGACSDALAPKNVTLSIATSSAGAEIKTTQSGYPIMSCTPTIVLSASGSTDAELTGGLLRFYSGPDRKVVTDSSQVSLDALVSLIGTTEIKEGTHVTTRIVFYDGLPFEMDFVLHYAGKQGGATHDAMMHLVCGPTPSPSSTGPTLTSTTTTTHTPVQPGDTIRIAWNASDADGLWETAFRVSGVVDTSGVTALRLANSASGSIEIPIPNTAPFGDVYVDLATVGGSDYYVQHRVAALGVTDATPPRITIATLWDVNGDNTFPGLVGQVAEGDPMPISVAAVDNARPTWMIYQLTGPSTLRDSVAVPDGTTNNAIVKVSPILGHEWIGAPRLSVWMRDRAGNLSDSVTSAPDSLRVYPTITPPSVVGRLPYANTTPVYDARRDQVVSVGLGAIAFYSTATGAVTDSLRTATRPVDVDLMPGGDSLVVALPDAHGFGIVDLTQPAHPLTTITVPQLDTFPGSAPVRITATGNGKVVLWLASGINGNTALAYDLATHSSGFAVPCQLPWLNTETEVAPAGDRMHVLVGSAGEEMIYDAATGGCTMPYAPQDPYAVDYPYGGGDSSGTRFTFAGSIVDTQGHVLWMLPPDRGGYPPMVFVDATHLWMRQGTGVSLLDLGTGLFTKHIRLPFGAAALKLSPDRNTLIVIGEKDLYNPGPVSVARVDITGT